MVASVATVSAASPDKIEKLLRPVSSMRFSSRLLGEIDAVVAKTGLTRVQVIRYAIEAGLPQIAEGIA